MIYKDSIIKNIVKLLYNNGVSFIKNNSCIMQVRIYKTSAEKSI